MKLRRSWLVSLGVAALAIPAAAVADPGNGHGHGGGHGQGSSHAAQYVFKGTYGGDGLVSVDRGNGRVRQANLVGTDVSFDLTSAKLDVADTNGDAVIDASDVLTGDEVVVQAKLPKGDPGPQPFVAGHLIDQTNPAPDEETGEGA